MLWPSACSLPEVLLSLRPELTGPRLPLSPPLLLTEILAWAVSRAWACCQGCGDGRCLGGDCGKARPCHDTAAPNTRSRTHATPTCSSPPWHAVHAWTVDVHLPVPPFSEQKLANGVLVESELVRGLTTGGLSNKVRRAAPDPPRRPQLVRN